MKNLEHYRENGLVDCESSKMTHKGGSSNEGELAGTEVSNEDET
jgi:hypothetical protein